jgi:O-antigen/teichoic acid export membrane protein
MNTRKIVVDALQLSGLRVWNVLLALTTTYVTAGVLGHRGFGVLAAVALIPQLAVYGSAGWEYAITRELPHLRAAGEHERAERARATAFTAELGVTLLWMIAAAGAALWVESADARLALLLGAISLAVGKLTRLFVIDAFVEKDFRIQARVGMIVAVATAAFQILAAWRYGPIAAFGGMVAANAIGVAVYWAVRGLRLRPQLDGPELRRLTRIGLPMAVLALLSGTTGATAYIERTFIGGFAGVAILGLYAFGMSVNNYLIAFVGDFSRTYQPHLLEALARPADRRQLHTWTSKPALGVSLLAAAVGSVILAVMPLVIRTVLPAYEPVIAVLPVLMIAGLANCLTYVPGMLLNSSFANRQSFYTALWAAGTAAYAVLLWAGLRAGGGLMAAAAAASVPPLVVISVAIPMMYSYSVGSVRAALPRAAALFVPPAYVVAVHGAARAVIAARGGQFTGTLIGDELAAAALALTLTIAPLAVLASRTFDVRKIMRGPLQVPTTP